MKKQLLSVFLVFGVLFAFAQEPAGYYSKAAGKTGKDLKTALYGIIAAHTDVGYDGLYDAYKTTDDLNGKVWDMYSVKADGTADYWYTHNQRKCGSYSDENDCYNREHSFCDSWLGKASPQRSDLFHVIPTDGYVNNKRSSFPHGKVLTATWTSSNGSKLGKSDPATGYSGTVFEPIDEYKGDFARNYFYVATCYENKIAGWASNGSAGELLAGNSFPAYKKWFLDLMIQWHTQDPVSAKEITRNNAVYAIQKNRNPYIDHPEYVCAVWGTNCTSVGIKDVTKQNDKRIYPNPVSDILNIEQLSGESTIVIYNPIGQKVYTQSVSNTKAEINTVNYAPGIYFMQIYENQKLVQISKFVKK